MTNTYARDGSTYGFDFARPRSRAERIARLDALATLLDTAFILPGTNVRFGFEALIGLLHSICDAITTAISLYIVHEARQLGAFARHHTHARQSGARRIFWRGAGRRRRLRRDVASQPPQRSAVARVAGAGRGVLGAIARRDGESVR